MTSWSIKFAFGSAMARFFLTISKAVSILNKYVKIKIDTIDTLRVAVSVLYK